MRRGIGVSTLVGMDAEPDDIPDDEAPAEVLGFWRAYALLQQTGSGMRIRETFAIAIPSASTRRLQRFWEHGKGGAEVAWGTPGAMKRCIALNKDHMRDPGGYCAKRHKAVTGQWPTEGGKAGIPS